MNNSQQLVEDEAHETSPCSKESYQKLLDKQIVIALEGHDDVFHEQITSVQGADEVSAAPDPRTQQYLELPPGSHQAFQSIPLSPSKHSHETKILNLIAVAASWVGIQALWGTAFSVTGPYMSYLGMTGAMANLVWIWGPITGFIVAPMIGALSDECESKWGRRRPFMVAGLLSMTVFAFLFGFSGLLFGRTVFGQIFALTMFIGMDATINVMQTPVRALVSDIASIDQQATGQLLSVAFQGVGGLVASAVMLPFASQKEKHVFEVVTIILGINFCFILIACLFAHEKRYIRKVPQIPSLQDASSKHKATSCNRLLEPFLTIYGAIRHMSPRLRHISLIQFFSWFALFCLFTYKSTWWATVVYPGNNSVDATEQQLRDYGRGTSANDSVDLVSNALQALLSLALAVALERRWLASVQYLYAGMLATGGLVFYVNFAGAKGCSSLAHFTMSLIAIPIAAINSFPFALLGEEVRREQDRQTTRIECEKQANRVPERDPSPPHLLLEAGEVLTSNERSVLAFEQRLDVSSIPSFAATEHNETSLLPDKEEAEGRQLDIGVQFGILNWFIVLPQALVKCVDTLLVAFDNGDKVMLLIAISFTFAGIAAIFLSKPSSHSSHNNTSKPQQQDGTDSSPTRRAAYSPNSTISSSYSTTVASLSSIFNNTSDDHRRDRASRR